MKKKPQKPRVPTISPSFSMTPELLERIREAAFDEGRSASSWVAWHLERILSAPPETVEQQADTPKRKRG